MDTSRAAAGEIASRVSQTGTAKRQQRSVEEKRRIVEETLVEGASVARVARAHGVNANQVFGWRKLYLAGRLGGSGAVKLLPVHVSESSPSLATPARSEDSCSTFSAGTIHIELRHAQVHIAGSADPVLLRVLLECLRG
jgi:transposase